MRVMTRVLRIAAITEAVTWAGLLVAMYLKYVQDDHSRAVWMLGTLHGYVWMAYVLVVFLVRAEYRWDRRMTLIALASSVPPFATVPFEIWATGQLRAQRAADPLGQRAEPAQ
jgi:RND superfamily putative drug exporter